MVKNLPAIEKSWVWSLGWENPLENPLGQQPTPVFLPGEFHGQRSLVCYSPWGCWESNMTKLQSSLCHLQFLNFSFLSQIIEQLAQNFFLFLRSWIKSSVMSPFMWYPTSDWYFTVPHSLWSSSHMFIFLIICSGSVSPPFLWLCSIDDHWGLKISIIPHLPHLSYCLMYTWISLGVLGRRWAPRKQLQAPCFFQRIHLFKQTFLQWVKDKLTKCFSLPHSHWSLFTLSLWWDHSFNSAIFHFTTSTSLIYFSSVSLNAVICGFKAMCSYYTHKTKRKKKNTLFLQPNPVFLLINLEDLTISRHIPGIFPHFLK